MHLAATAGKVEFVKTLLAARGRHKHGDTNGWTALDAAIQAKQSDCIHLLLPDNSFAISSRTRGFATTLHEAAASGNIAVLATLLGNGNKPRSSKRTWPDAPTTRSDQEGHLGAAALLVDKGANVNVRNTEGQQFASSNPPAGDSWAIYDRPPTNWLERVGQDPEQEIIRAIPDRLGKISNKVRTRCCKSRQFSARQRCQCHGQKQSRATHPCS